MFSNLNLLQLTGELFVGYHRPVAGPYLTTLPQKWGGQVRCISLLRSLAAICISQDHGRTHLILQQPGDYANFVHSYRYK